MNAVDPTLAVNDRSPAVETKRTEAFVAAGSFPTPIAPDTEPVTLKSTAVEKATVTVCATAAEERSIEAIDEPEGLVLGLVARADEPRFPLTDPLTPNAVAEVNSTVRISLTGVPVSSTRLSAPLFDVLPEASRPAKSKG